MEINGPRKRFPPHLGRPVLTRDSTLEKKSKAPWVKDTEVVQKGVVT